MDSLELNRIYTEAWNGIWTYEMDEWWSDFFIPREQLIDNLFTSTPLLKFLKGGKEK